MQHFANVQSFERGNKFVVGKFGGAELARRDIDIRQSGAVALREYRCQVVVLVRAQQARIVAVPGVTMRRDLAAHQLLAGAGFLHLIADGDAIALLDQARDVAFGRVIRHAAHRDRLALFLVARGQRDFEFPRRRHGVFVEQLVEVAEPEQQQRAGDLLLDGLILPHQRRGGFGVHPAYAACVGKLCVQAA